jgi:sn-glycerol 3-phosphate transport system substrate-binding protein
VIAAPLTETSARQCRQAAFFVVVKQAPDEERRGSVPSLSAGGAGHVSLDLAFRHPTLSSACVWRFFAKHPNDEVAQLETGSVEPWPWEPLLFRIERDIVDPREGGAADKGRSRCWRGEVLAARPG